MPNTITCPVCGTESAENAGFCFTCGKGFRGKYLIAEDEARRMGERGYTAKIPAAAEIAAGGPQPSAQGDGLMQYRAIPFRASLQAREGADTAAKQLEDAINAHARKGWIFHSVAQVHATVQPGCLGAFIGHVAVSVAHDYIVFAAPAPAKPDTP